MQIAQQATSIFLVDQGKIQASLSHREWIAFNEATLKVVEYVSNSNRKFFLL